MEPTYFSSPAKLRAWLAKHHATKTELVVGFHKKGSGTPSITWPELVEECLCYGWIDGIRRRIDEERYSIRITPRKPKSNWSAVNVKLVAKLRKEGRMTPAGEAAFTGREAARTGTYSFEQETIAFDAAREKAFRARRTAWAWFAKQAPSYQRGAAWYVMSAKREDTRDRRFAHVLEHAARGERIPQLSSPSRRKS